MWIDKKIKKRGIYFPVLIATLLFYAVVYAQTDAPPEERELGARIYSDNCLVCHGEGGKGRVGAELSKNWPAIRPDLLVRSIIETGVSGSVMPAWSQKHGGPLSDDEIDALVTYILSWQTGEFELVPTRHPATRRPPITPIPELQGDPNRGAVLFDENCAFCHGLSGEGRIGKTLFKAWPGVRPDLFIANAIHNGVPNSVMPAWGKENGGPLNKGEIDDVVSFILSHEDTPSPQTSPTVVSVSPTQLPWMRDWVGIVVLVLLLAIIFGAAFYFQRKK
jgi:mono/diheme cytochrome c family protein